MLSVRADDTVCERPFLRTVRWKVNTILSVCDPLESAASLSVIVLGRAPMVRFALYETVVTPTLRPWRRTV